MTGAFEALTCQAEYTANYVAYAHKTGLDNIQKRSWGLAQLLRDQFGTIKGAQVHEARERDCAIVSFSIEGLDSSRLDFEACKLPLLLRAAPHYFNTEDEIGQMVAALKAQLN